MSKNNGDKYPNWRVFIWIIGIIIVALGAIFSIILVTKVDVAVIKTEITHIKDDMKEIKDALTANIGTIINEKTPQAKVVPGSEHLKGKIFADEPTIHDSDFVPDYPKPLAQIVVPEPRKLPISNDPAVIAVLERLNIATTTTQAP